MRRGKLAVLTFLEMIGVFRIAEKLTAGGLQILCYHGFELVDECRFRPQLFISRDVFAERLRYLKERGFSILPLDDALSKLRSGTLPRRAVVITVDDGFYSTLSVAAKELSRFGMPATVYVTTYYVEKGTPVFRLAMQYCFWKAGATSIGGEGLERILADFPSLNASIARSLAPWDLIRYGESLQTEGHRQRLLAMCAAVLQQDVGEVIERRALSLMTPVEVASLIDHGLDVQLHTHRHRFPVDDEAAAVREIEDNAKALEHILGRRPDHFCYPSGIFSPAQWPWLEKIGVQSATTCLPGVNRRSTPPYALTRFLDSQVIVPVEFRAELSGFNEIMRKVRRALRRKTLDGGSQGSSYD